MVEATNKSKGSENENEKKDAAVVQFCLKQVQIERKPLKSMHTSKSWEIFTEILEILEIKKRVENITIAYQHSGLSKSDKLLNQKIDKKS